MPIMKMGWFKSYKASFIDAHRFRPVVHVITGIMCLGYTLEYFHHLRREPRPPPLALFVTAHAACRNSPPLTSVPFLRQTSATRTSVRPLCLTRSIEQHFGMGEGRQQGRAVSSLSLCQPRDASAHTGLCTVASKAGSRDGISIACAPCRVFECAYCASAMEPVINCSQTATALRRVFAARARQNTITSCVAVPSTALFFALFFGTSPRERAAPPQPNRTDEATCSRRARKRRQDGAARGRCSTTP